MRTQIAPLALFLTALSLIAPAPALAQSASAQQLTAQARDHLARGDLILARKRLLQAIALDPGHAPAWLELAALRERSGELDEALRLYGVALERNPASARIHVARALLLERLGRLAEAGQDVSAAVSLAPSDRAIRSDALEFYVRRKNWSAALQQSRALLLSAASAPSGELADARLHTLALQVLADDIDPVRAGRHGGNWQRRAMAAIAQRTGGM